MDPRELAEDVLSSTDVAFLATCEGNEPRVRPVNVALREGLTLWIASYTSWRKVAQLRSNPNVEVCVLKSSGAHVRIVGHGLIEESLEEKRRILDAFPLMQRYFKEPADPDYTLIKVVPIGVTVKDAWVLDYLEVPI